MHCTEEREKKNEKGKENHYLTILGSIRFMQMEHFWIEWRAYLKL